MQDATTILPITVNEPLDNMGGCRDFTLAFRAWVSAMVPELYNVDQLGEDTETTFSNQPVECRVTEDTADFRETQGMGPNGDQWELEFTCVAPADTIEQRQNIQAIARHKNDLILYVPDNNGITRRMGDWNIGASMTYEYTTGAGSGQRNQYRLRFAILLDGPAPIVERHTTDDSHLALSAD